MLTRMTQRIIAAPKLVLTLTVVVLALCGAYGLGAADKMLAGGYEDPGAESSHARDVLADEFAQGGMQFVIKLDARPGTDATTDPQVIAARDEILAILDGKATATGGYVEQPILTVWNSPNLAGELLSTDRSSTQNRHGDLRRRRARAGQREGTGRSHRLRAARRADPDGRHGAGSTATINAQTTKDLCHRRSDRHPDQLPPAHRGVRRGRGGRAPGPRRRRGDRRHPGSPAPDRGFRRCVDLRAEPDDGDGPGPGDRLHAAHR
ncbi:hypothetical protein nbrc107696_46380 [Gordonia spumicola]|uniref:MMPL family protein n=1 Tax=Gordonia spumicola TaxID=589161 RepID=A0A7I9VG50_9ACTN|nr:hypothetical protein nbrc107696_46380 [Gordonia spumicola]